MKPAPKSLSHGCNADETRIKNNTDDSRLWPLSVFHRRCIRGYASFYLFSVFSVPLWLVLFANISHAIDFDTEIVPVFTKSGCNAGSCHGAAAGRGGFHLSLLGGDPAADHDAIVNALEGRRINLAKPGESLLLAKPTGDLPHEGGVRLEDGSAGERRLLDWIGAGAHRSQSPRKLTHFELGPNIVANKVGVKIPLRATARFDDGKPEDVTAWTVFTSSDNAALELVDEWRARAH
jgi:hypothetical protein